MTFTIQKDYERTPEFRKFRQLLPEPAASFVFLKLWVELSYQAVRQPVGCLARDDYEFFAEQVCASVPDLTHARLLEILLASGCLSDEVDNLFCEPFFNLNRELSIEFRAHGVKGTDGLFILGRRKKFEKIAANDVLSIDPSHLKDVDGLPATDQEKNRLVVLIRMLDSIMERPERDKHDFPDTLVQDACRLVRRITAMQMNALLYRLMSKRKRSGIPRTAEQFLAHIDIAIEKLRPEEGWDWWAKLLRQVPEKPVQDPNPK